MKQDKKKILVWICMAFAVAVIVYGIWHIFAVQGQYKKADEEYMQLQETAVRENPEASVPEAVDEEKPVPPITVDLATLQKQNPDTVGWIYYPDTGINYPIMQDEDNSYYINHTWQGEKNAAGSIFLDTAASENLSDYHSILYGHNMRNGSMFGSLKKIRTIEVAKDAPYIWIFLPDGAHRYQIFSWHDANVTDDSFKTSFVSEDEKKEWLEHITGLSEMNMHVEVGTDDKVITLSTCTSNSRVRFLVHGVER